MSIFRIARLALVATAIGWGSSAAADLFVGHVQFEGEENVDQMGRLHFTLDHVSWKGEAYQPGTTTRFALETVFGGGFRADLVLFQADDLGKTVTSSFPLTDGSAGRGLANLGSSGISAEMGQAIRGWQVPERAVTGWIIANAEELVNMALASGRIGADRVENWDENAALFEQFLRRAATPLQSAIALADSREAEARELTTTFLVPVVQPGLKNLGYYDGAVDGYWGAGTRNAARDFQISLGAVPTGWLTLDQIGQLRQAYGAGLNQQAASQTPWRTNEADIATLRTQAEAQIASLVTALSETELALKDMTAAREMAVASLRNSRSRVTELEAKQTDEATTAAAQPENAAQIASLEAEIARLEDALSFKSQETEALAHALSQANGTPVQDETLSNDEAAELLAKLQESSETIAALNAQLEDETSTSMVPIQRFNSIRDTLTRRVSTLNTMLVDERDNTTEYRNKWFQAQADLESFQDACRDDTACAQSMGLN